MLLQRLKTLAKPRSKPERAKAKPKHAQSEMPPQSNINRLNVGHSTWVTRARRVVQKLGLIGASRRQRQLQHNNIFKTTCHALSDAKATNTMVSSGHSTDQPRARTFVAIGASRRQRQLQHNNIFKTTCHALSDAKATNTTVALLLFSVQHLRFCPTDQLRAG